MRIVYSTHAEKRMKQRGITRLEVEQVLNYPQETRRTRQNLRIATGIIKGRELRIVFSEKERYKKIVTVM